MAAYVVNTFADIIEFVRAELKVQSTDGVTLTKIKREINAVYQQRVLPLKNWSFLESSTQLSLPAYLNTGTVDTTLDSASITFSSAPASSVTGYWFSVDGSDKRYKISAHTGGSTSATLSTAFAEASVNDGAFKLWKDVAAVSSTLAETTEITRDDKFDPLTAVGFQEFKRRVNQNPKAEGPPEVYHSHLKTDGTRELYYWPSVYNKKCTLHVDGIITAAALDADADTPAIPPKYRIVLAYGALASSWVRERNEATANRNEALFKETLERMAGKLTDSVEYPSIVPSRQYLSTKRRKRRRTW